MEFWRGGLQLPSHALRNLEHSWMSAAGGDRSSFPRKLWGVTQSVGDVSKNTALGYCLTDMILFIYKNLQKYLIPLLFFSPSWTSWSAQRLQCSQAHLLQRCLPACFNTLLTSIDICVKRDLMHWENEAHDLHVQLLNGLDKIKHLHPVKFTWVMWNANTALWTPDSEVMQQGVVNMSWQVHQRSVDFPQNNKQQRYFHSAWDILSFDRIIFWEYKTHKEVSILPNLLFIIFAVLYWFPNLFILRFLAGFCSVLRTFTFPFTDISWTSYICHSSLGISCHLKPVQMVRT